MQHLFRATVIACGMALAFSAQAAKLANVAKPEAAASSVEVEFGHQLGEAGEERLQKLVDRFNQEQKGMAVKLVRLGQGAKPAPMNLLRRQDASELLSSRSAFRPLYQVMSETKMAWPGASLSSDLKAGVADEKGRLVALPVAYSTPVLFYDKKAFRKAGLDPEKPPRTWWEVQQAAGKLYDAGSTCPYTTSWPTWVHVDNLSALSGATVATGKGELAFNGLPQIKHVALLASWSKARYFRTFGHKNEADQHFQSGECAMITTDSAMHTEFRGAEAIEVGVAPMPHHDDVYGGRQHTLADGASLWVGNGYKSQDYKVVAKFVTFLMAPDTQLELARLYGQLPLSQAGRGALKSKLVNDGGQTYEVAYASLKGEGATSPLRVSAIDPVRLIIDEELDAVWNDSKPAKLALDTAVTRGNAVLNAKPALKKAVPF